MKYIFSKIFGAYITATIILLTAVLAFTYQTVEVHYINMLTKDMHNLNVLLEKNILDFVHSGQTEEMNLYIEGLDDETGTRISVIEPDGTVIADSQTDAKKMENHSDRPEFSDALKSGKGSAHRYSNTLEKNMLYVAKTLRSGGNTVAVVRVSLYDDDVNLLINSLLKTIINLVIAALFISFALIYVFTRSITNPIKELADASEKLAGGDFDVKVKVKSKDEIRNLADSFNKMTDEIKRLFDELNIKNVELQNIIGAIKDGMLVLNNSGSVILANAAAEKIVGKDNIIGAYYRSLISDNAFSKFVKKVFVKQKSYSAELIIDDIHYLCSGHWLKSKDEVIVILYDLSEIKEFEKIKKDFVVNVSHELRTPLTAIKGFIETLEDDTDVSDQNRHFLNIIHRHTNRLINIVNDLLLLSELENTGSKLELKKTNLNTLIANTLVIFQQKANEKNLKLKFKTDKDLPEIKADGFKLEQMLLNLIDNAVKYTDEGSIRVKARQKGKNIRIEIEDTGLGIPQDKAERIFERFYILDKSRSRKVGGTGLGLSIVKHIVNLHKGGITVKGTPGKGTTFTIDLPL